MLALATTLRRGIIYNMLDAEKPSRYWRIIAQELALEADPKKIRVLLDELTRAIRFVKYEDSEGLSHAPKPV